MSSGDAGAAGDAGQAQQGEAQQGDNIGGPSPDFGALIEQQGQQSTQQFEQLRDMFQQFQQQQPQAEPEGEQQPDLPDLGFLESGDPQFDQELAQNLQSIIAQEAERVAQQQVAPLQEQFEQQRTERAAEALTEEFPDLREHENAARLIDLANHAAQAIGDPKLASNPEFWRYVHATDLMYKQAAEESAGSPPAHVEGAGGAGAGQQQQPDLGDLIVNGGEGAPLGRRVLPFQ